MTAPGTAVATSDKRRALAPEHQQIIDENRARNAVIQQIRGTIWSKEMNENQIRALAQYCRENNLDAARHVEVLGGRIYLTAEFYDERGASLILDGIIQPHEPEYINADARLDELAEKGDEWAAGEKTRRLRERIKFAVPEKAAAAVVQRFTITQTARTIVGVNWCGGGVRDKDPVGNAEPAKTAQTRARRRAWRQIAEVIPGYGAIVKPLEERARALQPILTVEASDAKRLTRPVITNLGYEQDAPRVVDGEDRPIPRENVIERSEAHSDERVATSATADASRAPAESTAASESPALSADAEIDVVTRHTLSAAGQWVVPAGDLRGQLLGTLDNERLVALRDSFTDNAKFASKYAGTIEAIETVLEERREFAE